MDYTITGLVSKDTAKYRASVASLADRPGKCFRLYPEDNFNKFQESIYPKILSSRLSSILLQLKKLNFKDLIKFDFLDLPGKLNIY